MPQMPSMDMPLTLPLATTLKNRDRAGTKDARLVNCYVELDPDTGEYWVEKRLGLSAPVYFLATATNRGMYLWQRNPFTSFGLVQICGANVYLSGTLLGGIIAPVNTEHFQQMKGSPQSLVFGDGQKAYYIQSGVIHQITDANFPTTFVPGWAYLDGTLYVMDFDGNIFGSKNLDDPSVWDPLNKIVARVEPDGAVALAKSYTYVVAMKQWTTEVFYDAGNAAGSPLAPVPGAFLNYGCLHGDTVQDIDGTLVWVSASKSRTPQIVRMDALQVTVISTPAVERLIETAQYSGGFYSLVCRLGGHRFYVVTLAALNLTLVYDIDQKFWYRWTDVNGNYWPIMSSASDPTASDPNKQHLFMDSGVISGKTYAGAADYIYSNDNGSVVPVDIYTANFDGGVDRLKSLNRMSFSADQVVGSSLSVRVSDDDYQSWSNPRVVDLSTPRPALTACGSFHRRAWNLRHQADTSFRVKSSALQLDKGSL